MDSLIVKTLTKREANLVAEGVFLEFRVIPNVVPQPGIGFRFAVAADDSVPMTKIASIRIWADGFLKGLQEA